MTTTEYEPLYPLFLAAARWLTLDHVRLVQALQSIVGAAGAVLLLWLAEALTDRTQVGVVAAGLYAVDPLLVRHAADATESTLVLVLLLASTYAFATARTTGRTLAAGILFGLLVVARTMTLPFAALAAILMAADRRPARAVALALTALLVASPFALRNYRLYGRCLPTRSGVNLFVGNSEYSSGLLPAYSPDILQPYADAIVASERPDLAAGTPDAQAEADDLLARRAWDEMRRHPARTLWLKIRNVGYFFSPRLVPSRLLLPETRIHLGTGGQFTVENSPPRPLAGRGRLRGVVRRRAAARVRGRLPSATRAAPRRDPVDRARNVRGGVHRVLPGDALSGAGVLRAAVLRGGGAGGMDREGGSYERSRSARIARLTRGSASAAWGYCRRRTSIGPPSTIARSSCAVSRARSVRSIT